MAADKTMWWKPGLTVLVRSRPEEAVLTHCKSGGSTYTGPNNNVNKCTNPTGASGKCTKDCNSLVIS